MVGNHRATSHSLGDLLSLPKQATYQDIPQPGALPSQCVVDTSFYRNQIDRSVLRTDSNLFTRQDPFSAFHQSDAYPTVYSVDGFRGAVDEREYICRPSTPIVSPVRLPRPRMPCPMISITSDNDKSSILYQDDSDESSDKIMEEDEDNIKHNEIGMNNFLESSYSIDNLNSFERITPPQEYAEAAEDYKHSLTFDKNVFDTIPYIDQTDDTNVVESSERVQTELNNRYCDKVDYDCGSSLRKFQRHLDVDCNSHRIRNFPKSNELNTRTDSNLLSIDTYPPNKSMSMKNATIDSSSATESDLDDSSCLRNTDSSAKRALNLDERYETKLDDISNFDDCADESSSTINDDCASSRTEGEEGVSISKMSAIMPELHLDLSGLNSDDVSSDESKTEKCWKSPEEVRLGSGRVAALAKHFSKLGDAGLIRFKSTKLTDSRQFVSEPNIMSPEENEEHLHRHCHAQKEYRSDSDLTVKETDENSQITSAGKRSSVILLDLETDGNFVIEKCRFHRCGAKHVTVAKVPSMNDVIKGKCKILKLDAKNNVASTEAEDTSDSDSGNKNFLDIKEDTSTKSEDCDTASDSGKSQFKAIENRENAPSEKVGVDKLSLEQQQIIAEQLEQFLNLDNTDAPLFIPERSVEQVSSSSKSEMTNGVSALQDSSFADRSTELSSEKLASIDTDSSSQIPKRAFDSLSSPSVRVPLSSHSSVVLSLSNVTRNSLPLLENAKSQAHQCCEKRPKSCLFIDVSRSSTKNCPGKLSLISRSSNNSSILPSRVGACSQAGSEHKLNVLRLRVARQLCSSEDNLIGVAICDHEETEKIADQHRRSVKLTRSCESVLNNYLFDSADQTRNTRGNLNRKEIASLRNSYNDKRRSLEELKSKARSKKRNNSVDFPPTQSVEVQTNCEKFFNDKLNSDNEGEIQRNRCRSLQELKSERESRQHDSRKTPILNKTNQVQKSNQVKERLRTKCANGGRKESVSELSRESETKDGEWQKWKAKRRSQNEMDISKRKSDTEKDGWSFREISLLTDRSASSRKPNWHVSCILVEFFFYHALPEYNV